MTLAVDLTRPAQPDRAARPYDPDLDWTREALCTEVDTEIFFPEKGGSAREGKAVCQTCPVTAACLAYALRHDERFGIWGGRSERERRRLRGDST